MIIDITIANYNLATRICNWNVGNHLHFSDHYRISFSINNCSNFRVAKMTDWKYKKGDWVKFKKKLDQGLKKWSNARHWSFTSIELKVEFFCKIIKHCSYFCHPPKKM